MLRIIILIGIVVCMFGWTAKAQQGYIFRFAGNGIAGFSGDGGPATDAQLNRPTDVFKDGKGNVYIADRSNNRIRKVNTSGIISTIAGNGLPALSGDGGPATAASLNAPKRVVVDRAGKIYIADQHNNVIRMIDTAGIIHTIAGTGIAGFSGDGGPATLAQLDTPTGVAVDLAGNIFISDSVYSRIRKIDPSGIISTYAGGGTVGFTADGVPATSVSLCTMRYVSTGNDGTVYFTNQNCWHFLRITTDGKLYNVAGNALPSYSGDGGPADSADVEGPFGICPDNRGNVYLTPCGNKRVRRVNAQNIITTIAGTGTAGYSGDGGPAVLAVVSSSIYGIYADSIGNIYFADMGNNVVRSLTVPTYTDTICQGESITLHSSTGGGTWSSSNTAIANVGLQTGIVQSLAAGNVSITYYDSSYAEVFILVVKPAPVINANIQLVKCYGNNDGSINVNRSGDNGAYNYIWSTGDTLTYISNLSPGAYWLRVSDSTMPCISTDTFLITQPDSLELIADIKNDACRSGIGSIKVFVTGGIAPYYYSWSNYAINDSIYALAPGDYTLVINDKNNCINNFDLTVKEDSCLPIIVHDVITPNGDGVNDVWVIEGLQNYPKNTVQVFDKWGDMVYEQSRYNNDWGGRAKNGDYLADGTYFYVLKLNEKNGAGGMDVFKGAMLIKR